VLTVPAITIEQNGIAQTPKVVGATDECQSPINAYSLLLPVVTDHH
jgi:hypothetical protein